MAGTATGPLLRALARWHAFTRYLSEDFLGGPKALKLAWVINFQKGGTSVVIVLLMWLYNNFSTPAWAYLALHGTYGLCWILKDLAFPDRNWQRRVTFGGAALAFLLVLGPYWALPFLMISDVLGAPPAPSGPLLALAISLHTLGVSLMLASDAQKHFTLKYRRGLIEDGFFRHVRHPNYLGEVMIYGSYALLVGHWIAWAILACVWVGVFLPNMLLKELSLSRYPQWAAYRARTGMLLPWPAFWAGAPRPASEVARTESCPVPSLARPVEVTDRPA
jgi:protein-S-isoprenylcysteine O-methyltransferase Ste14